MAEPNRNYLFQLPDALRARFLEAYRRAHPGYSTQHQLAQGIREAMEEFIQRQSPGSGDSEGPG